MPAADPSTPTGQERPVLLFQGDSITNAGRRRGGPPNHPHSLGSGYAALAASALLSADPDRGWRCYNRGVGGDTVADLAARWADDCLALAPDVVSVLVGINDLWGAGPGEDAAARYEEQLRSLLDRTRSALPDVTLLIGEPFVVPGGSAVDATWPSALQPYRGAAQRGAADAGATWIPYQSVFDEALRDAPGPYWAADGIHPTPAGHYRMAQAWLEAFRTRH
ncbi:MAG: SGNH/GDSL hydrolase family protein [Salinibacter sp.]